MGFINMVSLWHTRINGLPYLFNHIRAELLDGQGADISNKLLDHAIGVSAVSKIQDILYHIVAKWILDQG